MSLIQAFRSLDLNTVLIVIGSFFIAGFAIFVHFEYANYVHKVMARLRTNYPGLWKNLVQRGDAEKLGIWFVWGPVFGLTKIINRISGETREDKELTSDIKYMQKILKTGVYGMWTLLVVIVIIIFFATVR